MLRLFSASVAMLVLLINSAVAAPTGYTQQGAFMANLPGLPNVTTFDEYEANQLIQSGNSVNGIILGYNFGGVELKIATSLDNGYTTTSGAQFLGTADADILQDGDAIAFGFEFEPVSAFGLYIITNDDMADGDVYLNAGGLSVGLVAAHLQNILADGSRVYFLGVSDPIGVFGSASITTVGNGTFLFNIDDLITAIAIDTDGDGVLDTMDNCPNVPNGPLLLAPDDAGIAQRNTDGDALGDACDPDDDNDSLTDAEEAVLGTSRLNADTDGDGVDDGAEVANGSDPLVWNPLASGCDIDGTPGASVGDLLLLQRHLAGEIALSTAQQAACDLYPDDNLTISDRLRLERLLSAP